MSRHVGFGAETTYGTAVASTEFTEAVTETLKKNLAFEELAPLRAFSTGEVNLLTQDVGGDVEIYGNFQDCGLLLKHFFGSVDSTGANPYTHTFPASTGVIDRAGKSLTCEVRRDTDTRTWRYAGCKVQGFSLSASLDQSPRWRITLAGSSEATGTATTASFPTFSPMRVQDMDLTLGGTAVPCQSITITGSRTTDKPYIIGSTGYAVEPIDNGQIKVTVEVTALLTDAMMTTVYSHYDGDDILDLAVTINDGTLSITFNANKCRMTDCSGGVSGRERQLAAFTLESYFDTTATENLQIVLVNNDQTIP